MRTLFSWKYTVTIAIAAILLSATPLHAEDTRSERNWSPLQLFMQTPAWQATPASGIFLDRNVAGLRLGLNYSYEKHTRSGTRVIGLDIGFPNSINHGITGIQVAPFVNYSLGGSNAIQIAGLANIARKNFNGVQIAPILNVNINKSDKDSLPLLCVQAGLANGCAARYSFQIGAGNFSNSKSALQISALTNIAGRDNSSSNGLQAGGLIINLAESFRGAQIGGIINIASGSLTGLQLAVVNRVTDRFGDLITTQEGGPSGQLTGMQIGLVNIANEVRGVQIGLINATYKLKGLQIGVLNLHYDGLISFMPLVNIGF